MRSLLRIHRKPINSDFKAYKQKNRELITSFWTTRPTARTTTTINIEELQIVRNSLFFDRIGWNALVYLNYRRSICHNNQTSLKNCPCLKAIKAAFNKKSRRQKFSFFRISIFGSNEILWKQDCYIYSKDTFDNH